MGFFDFLGEVGELFKEGDEAASEYVGEKSMQQLYKSIVTNSTTSSWAVKELKSRLRQMSNKELRYEYYEVCDDYSSQRLLNIFESLMDSRKFKLHIKATVKYCNYADFSRFCNYELRGFRLDLNYINNLIIWRRSYEKT